jgi:hypothetical protein
MKYVGYLLGAFIFFAIIFPFIGGTMLASANGTIPEWATITIFGLLALVGGYYGYFKKYD